MSLNLVDTTGVHKEVCVDFHDCLHRALGPNLMHDVLQHCPLYWMLVNPHSFVINIIIEMISMIISISTIFVEI